jgi:hypothetical protein
MDGLATAYWDKGAKAMTLYEETLEKRKAKLGSDHRDTLSMNSWHGVQKGFPKRPCRSEEALAKANLARPTTDTLSYMQPATAYGPSDSSTRP